MIKERYRFDEENKAKQLKEFRTSAPASTKRLLSLTRDEKAKQYAGSYQW